MTEVRIEEIVAAIEVGVYDTQSYHKVTKSDLFSLIADWRAKKAEIERLTKQRDELAVSEARYADLMDDRAEAMRVKCQAAVEALHDPQDDGWEDALNAAADAIAELKQS